MAAEHIKHWDFNGTRITRIVEVNDHTDPFTMLSADCAPDEGKNHPWLIPHFALPDGTMKISFQAFAMRTPEGKTVIIDTCIGNDRQREYDIFCNMQTSYLEDLQEAGYDPLEADYVLCSHLHFDHVGWNTRRENGKWVPTFPNARYLFGKNEWDCWKKIREDGGPHLEHLEDSIDPIFEAGLVDLIEPPHQVCKGVELFPTPGHTPGHVSVLITAGDQQIAITCDMMHHPIQLARPDFKVNADMDKEQGVQTRIDFCKRFENKKAYVIGMHFSDPTGGWIVRDEKNWRFTWD